MFQSAELSVREYLEMLRRRRWFIATVALLVTVLGAVPVALQSPVYASTASIQLRSEQSLSAFGDGTSENELTRSRDLATDVEVITSPETRAAVVEALGPDGPSFDDVFAAVNGFTEIVEVTVTADSAAGATDSANAYVDTYVDLRRSQTTEAIIAQSNQLRSQVQSLESRQQEIEQQIAENLEGDLFVLDDLRRQQANLTDQISQLSQRADAFDVDVALRQDATKVVSRAPLNLSPVAPKPVQAGIIALVIGLLIGVCAAILREILQDRLATPDDLEALDPDVPLLAAVPHVDIDLDDPDHRLPTTALESFRYLRTSIKFRSLETRVRSIVVTSALSGEGKTTTAVNLAAVLSESGARVVLVDADMRRPAVHARVGLTNEVGLSSVIAGTTPLNGALRFVRPSLAVLTAGPATGDASELLGDDRFAALVKSLQSQCDMLVIDAPPVLPVADALLAANAADAGIIVGRLGVVRRRELKATLKRFRDAKLPVLGFVANDTSTGSRYGGYYGGYGGYGADEPAGRTQSETVDV